MLPSNRQKREILRNTGTVLPPGVFLEDVPIITMDKAEWRPHFELFAHKMILALHYRYRQVPLSPNGRIWFDIRFNFEAGRLAPDLEEWLATIQEDHDLRIGDGELIIAHSVVSDAPADSYAISVRRKMLIIGFSTEEPEHFSHADQMLGPLFTSMAA